MKLYQLVMVACLLMAVGSLTAGIMTMEFGFTYIAIGFLVILVNIALLR